MPKSRGDRPVEMATSCVQYVWHQLGKSLLSGESRGEYRPRCQGRRPQSKQVRDDRISRDQGQSTASRA